jgi:two-component system chemotaxis response regulator CheY
MRILVADDDPMTVTFLRWTLERMGHEVSCAADGLEAWEMLERDLPQVLVSDWGMPRLDGPDLCRRVRAREGAYLYVILLTARDRREDRLAGLHAGADDFLTKPPDAGELAVRLEVAARILAVHDALARQNARLAELAAVDELTGVKNRRRFREDLDLLFEVASRQSTLLSLVMIDVDHFKTFNDAFGHPAGDEVLRQVASALLSATRAQDVMARYGGEEFVVLLPATGASDSLVLAGRLRARVADHDWPLRPVTVSVGAATTGAEVASPEALVEAADRALYLAKRTGRNRVCHYEQCVASS